MIIGGTYEELKAFIANNSTLSIDVETNSKNRRTAVLVGFSICNRDGGYYVCARSWDPASNQLVPTQSNGIVSDILTSLKGKQLYAWNGAYDFPVIAHNTGVDLLPYLYIDGMLLRHTINENEFSYGLKDIARAEFGLSAADEQEELKAAVIAAGGKWTKEQKDMYMAPWNVLGKYCVQDGVLTCKIIARDLPKLHADGLESFFLVDEVMPLYREVTIPMEMRGIAIDLRLVRQTGNELRRDIDLIKQSILQQIEPHLAKFKQWWLTNEYPPKRSGEFAQGICVLGGLELPKTASGKFSLAEAGIKALPESRYKQILLQQERLTPDEIFTVQLALWEADGSPVMFNLSSKHHLKKLFFDELGEKPLSLTPTGLPQVDDDFIASVASKYKWCEELHVYNRLNKILGTYVERVLELQENGRYYASFFQHRTVSGRYSGDLQQLPRKLEDSTHENPLILKYVNKIRDFYIADDDGALIDADYESLEPHIFAHVSGDDRLRAIFHKGHDFYSTIAIDTERLQGVSADKSAPNYLGKVNKAKRQFSKGYSLGIPYGLGGYKLQFELNIPLADAEALVKGYLRAYPDLAAWMKASEATALKQGFIRTQGGRLRRFPRLQQIYRKYGAMILDDLELWKALNESPGLYAMAKKDRKELKNYLNNAKNVQIQALASSVVNKAAIQINRNFKQQDINALVIAQIHDELLISCVTKDVDKAAQIVKNTMENIWDLSVKLKAEPSIGTRYGDLK